MGHSLLRRIGALKMPHSWSTNRARRCVTLYSGLAYPLFHLISKLHVIQSILCTAEKFIKISIISASRVVSKFRIIKDKHFNHDHFTL
jgi:hypothetical protein